MVEFNMDVKELLKDLNVITSSISKLVGGSKIELSSGLFAIQEIMNSFEKQTGQKFEK